MGLVENLLEHVSPLSVLLFVIVGYGLWTAVTRVQEHRRIMALGSRAPTVKANFYKLPFGFDFIAKSVTESFKHRDYENWLGTMFGEAWTSESRVLGRRMVFTADPENTKAILATQFSDYGKGEQFHKEWYPLFGDSIFGTDGELWHTSRQMLRPQFTRTRVSDLHCFETHFQTFMKGIANGGPMAYDGQPVDLKNANGQVLEISDLFFRLTLDITTDFLLGADVKSLSNPKQEFADAFNKAQHLQNLKARMSRLANAFPWKEFDAAVRIVNRFIGSYIDRALQLSPDELASKTKSDQGYTFLHEIVGFTRDRQVLRDQIFATLLAGRDTTAGTMSWAMYELARHPECVKKLRQEILDTVGKERMPTYEDLKDMNYLKAVINETLRIYPAVPFNVRLALKDTTLPRGGGPDGTEPIGILEGTPIGYAPIVMQRRPELYPAVSDKFADPLVFNPERWEHWFPKPHYYIPFNAGPRICVGQQFALTQMSYILCRLIQRFERIENHMYEIDGGHPQLRCDITLSPGQGVRIALFEPQDD